MKISQREAQRLRKQVKVQADRIQSLEWLVRRVRRGDVGEGVEVYKDDTVGSSLAWAIQTSQRLGHMVVARHVGGNGISYRAMPLPSEDVKP